MRSDLRVGLIHWAFPPTTGGVESHVWDLAQRLSSHGCAVTVITGEGDPTRSPLFDVVTTDLLGLDFVRHQSPNGTLYRDELRRELGAIIAGLRLSVVHGHNLHHFSPEPALALHDLRSRLGFRLHHTFHETWPDVLHESPVYRSWDGNYAVSRHVQHECRQRIGFEPRLLQLGVDTDRFQAGPGPRGISGPTILHPARLLPWKGADDSVRMLARLRDRGIAARLILTDTQRIADWNQEMDAYRPALLGLIHELGLMDAVHLRPARYAEMPALYGEADLVVYPTVAQEPCGLVPLEAMSCGLPVVATMSGGMMETIVHGETGYLFRPGELDEFATYVARLLTDPELARAFGSAGRRRVVERFNIESYVNVLLGYYAGRS